MRTRSVLLATVLSLLGALATPAVAAEPPPVTALADAVLVDELDGAVELVHLCPWVPAGRIELVLRLDDAPAGTLQVLEDNVAIAETPSGGSGRQGLQVPGSTDRTSIGARFVAEDGREWLVRRRVDGQAPYCQDADRRVVLATEGVVPDGTYVIDVGPEPRTDRPASVITCEHPTGNCTWRTASADEHGVEGGVRTLSGRDLPEGVTLLEDTLRTPDPLLATGTPHTVTLIGPDEEPTDDPGDGPTAVDPFTVRPDGHAFHVDLPSAPAGTRRWTISWRAAGESRWSHHSVRAGAATVRVPASLHRTALHELRLVAVGASGPVASGRVLFRAAGPPVVGPRPVVPRPAGVPLVVDAPSRDALALTWGPLVPAPSHWTVRIRPAGQDTWRHVGFPGTAETGLVRGLRPDTAYELQLRPGGVPGAAFSPSTIGRTRPAAYGEHTDAAGNRTPLIISPPTLDALG